MAARKSGLGKGLDSLIPEYNTKTGDTETKKGSASAEGPYQMVSIGSVHPSADQPRQYFDEDALNELADSIKTFGVLQPLVVVKEGNGYRIIAGERRWRAAKQAGLKQIPVVIKELSDQEVLEISLIENIQREDLDPIEEARAYQRLLEEFHLKQEDVAKRVAKSRTAVTNSMRLLKLPQPVQQQVIAGSLSAGHARAILAVEKEEDQIALANRVIEEGLTVRDTEKLAKKPVHEKKQRKTETVSADDSLYRELEKKLIEALGTRVRIRNQQEKGRIEIEYYSQDELDRLYELLRGGR